jgi:hypothetical protein
MARRLFVLRGKKLLRIAENASRILAAYLPPEAKL